MSLPERIGRYTVVRPLASGGMAEVFLARQTGLRGMVKHVAVKRIRPELTTRSEIVDVFLDEIRLTADMAHPNVVSLYDAGEEDGTYFLAMELVEGADLRRLLSRALLERREDDPGGLPLPFVLRVASEAAHGLHYAHTRVGPGGEPLGLVHRDVSPSNLLVGYSGLTKVVDFGVARLLDATGRAQQALRLGKLAYMSPEQSAGEALEPTSDLFSLAVVVWELCTGQALFARDSETEIIDAVTSCQLPAEGFSPGLPPALEALLRRCLQRRPEQRLQSCEAFADALDALAAKIGACTAAEAGRLVARLCPREEPAGEALPAPAPAPDAPVEPTALDVSDRTEIERPLGSTTALRHNLPSVSADFIGRNTDLDRLEAALGGPSAWVTLVGPGGVGKTRLALRHAELQIGAYQAPGAGVWFCDLTEARDTESICRLLATTLEITLRAETIEAWAEGLGAAIARRGRMLLVLDNLEQVAPAAAGLLARWLDQAEGLHVIATSRRPLHGRGEAVLELEPLPTGGERPELGDAYRLFVDRAARSRPDYRPKPQEVPTIARIVEALEGLPLAIELAAARMSILGTEQILERLSSRFALLRRPGSAAGPARQQTLAATIAWSWELLEPWERAALAQATVFRGGFTLEAAEAVLDLSAFPEAPLIIDVVQSLKEHSLLRTRTAHRLLQPRFQLYESVHEYARGHLAPEQAEQASERHARHYGALAPALAAVADRGEGLRALPRLRAELDNLLAAEEHLAGRDEAGRCRILLSMDPVLHRGVPAARWMALLSEAVEAARLADDPGLLARAHALRAQAIRFSGRFSDAVEEAFVARELARRAKDRETEGNALSLAGFLAGEQGEFELARARLDEALELLADEKDPAHLALAHGRLGIVEAKTGDLAKARPHWERSVELFERADHPTGRSNNLQNLALIIQHEEPELALKYYEDAVAIFVSLGDRRAEASSLNNVGTVHMDLGNLDEARRCYQRILSIVERHEAPGSEAICLANYVILEHLAGRLGLARQYADRALEVAARIGDAWLTGLVRAHLAAVEARQGKVRLAREAFERSRQELDATGTTFFDDSFEVLEGLLDVARAREAAGRGDGRATSEHLEAARAKLAAATTPDAEGRIPAEHESDLRLCSRLLAAALAEMD
ncbi:MAG: protein kinase [Deltaproteobacteria bacterium]|nr:protein kinase [Deltaproteobacteria bacterium]